VCDVLVQAVRARTTSDRPVNLAFGGRASLLELLAVLEGILGAPIERRHVDPRPGDVRDSQADQTNLRALFPAVEPVGLDEGLRRTVEWFRTGAVT
jgi:UDP-glucose 4-epimerase